MKNLEKAFNVIKDVKEYSDDELILINANITNELILRIQKRNGGV